MEREDLAALENDIQAELTALYAEREQLPPDELPALELDIEAVASELATVKAERRRVGHKVPPPTPEEQLSALQAENRTLRALRQLDRDIAGRREEMKRLAAETAALTRKRRLLRLALRTPRLRKTQQEPTPESPEMILCDPRLLESSIADDAESDALYDLIGPDGGNATGEAVDADVADQTQGLLKTLSPKEEKVVRMRFGIGCEREHTREEIARECHVTSERVRQIEVQALRLLRSPDRALRLRALMAAR